MLQRLWLVGTLLASGCSAQVVSFEDDPLPEVCGGSICFAPEHLSVRRWGEGEVTLAAWAGTEQCQLPRTGEEPITGRALIVELDRPRPGARLPVITHERATTFEEPYATVRAVVVDRETGRALASEEGVSGEVTVLDIDSAEGRLRVRIRARWSSGVSGEQLLDVEGWPGCAPINRHQ
jgi:hypothetical protein